MRVANAKELTKMTRMLVLVIAGLMSPQDFVCRVGKTNVHASFVAVYVQDSLSRTVPMLASAKHTLRPPIGQLTSARRLAASCTPALVARTTTIQLHILIKGSYGVCKQWRAS
jgi:hypothetical protein